MLNLQINPDADSPLGRYYADWKKDLGVAREVPPFEELILWRLILLASELFYIPADVIDGEEVEAISAIDQMVEIIDGLMALEGQYDALVIVRQEDPESEAVKKVTDKIQEHLMAFRVNVQLTLSHIKPEFIATIENANRLMRKVGPTAQRNLDDLGNDLVSQN